MEADTVEDIMEVDIMVEDFMEVGITVEDTMAGDITGGIITAEIMVGMEITGITTTIAAILITTVAFLTTIATAILTTIPTAIQITTQVTMTQLQTLSTIITPYRPQHTIAITKVFTKRWME